MEDEKYIFNNKVYNITTSKKLYEYNYKEETGMYYMGRLPLYRNGVKTILSSAKGKLYETTRINGRISIRDIEDVELKRILIEKNEIDLLKEIYPETLNELEEV